MVTNCPVNQTKSRGCYIRYTYYYPIIYHVEYNSIQLEINGSDLVIRTAIAYFMWSLNQVIQSPVKTQP